ncbi:hypothetical protein MUCCIDRAFT_163594 [Mucor lusitanicus CBS 277.49]|uniref:Uncharacterized protein n=1 Tax=Mucor lusitanicus CBS 277.49 TaxID=747725 RepID=A0A162RC85_MUCCL|nr:hypothetical protein MUCCIDRAFT_163594 [Mucor lusitanicus CBS 277.49]
MLGKVQAYLRKKYARCSHRFILMMQVKYEFIVDLLIERNAVFHVDFKIISIGILPNRVNSNSTTNRISSSSIAINKYATTNIAYGQNTSCNVTKTIVYCVQIKIVFIIL